MVNQLARLGGRAAGPLLLRGLGLLDVAVVVLYHRVSPDPDPAYPPLAPAEFERHLDLLERAFRIVPLQDVVDARRRGEELRGACAITFDDGFHDFLQHAYPLLARRRLPVTHFVLSESLRSGQPTWNYRLNRLLARSSSTTERMRLAAKERWAVADEAERDAQLAADEQAAGITVDDRLMLRADDLLRCDPELVDWQSHGATHGMVSTMPPTRLAHELEASRRSIEAWTGRPVLAFSYPNGDSTAAAEAAVRDAGYTSGWRVDDRPVRSRSGTFRLPRYDLGRFPAEVVPLVLAGGLKIRQALG